MIITIIFTIGTMHASENVAQTFKTFRVTTPDSNPYPVITIHDFAFEGTIKDLKLLIQKLKGMPLSRQRIKVGDNITINSGKLKDYLPRRGMAYFLTGIRLEEVEEV